MINIKKEDGKLRINTIDELERYLEENCYSFQELSIGKHHSSEGNIIEKDSGRYNFAYSERGNKSVLKSFDNEKELVQYALLVIKRDKWANAHLVAWVYDEVEIHKAEDELNDMKILYERNDIQNYKKGVTAYRIFVFGKDILKLEGFKERFFKR